MVGKLSDWAFNSQNNRLEKFWAPFPVAEGNRSVSFSSEHVMQIDHFVAWKK
jgi:hypothetical protein